MAAIVTGFYRYTDIMFEWYQVLESPTDRSALKAFLSPGCITSPENPLRKPGIDGIELWMGTMPDGESRLMFSSAQIEYIRYWLKAMDLTKELLPLPSTDYLLTATALKAVSPVVYETVSAMRNALKMITKNNRRLKGGDEALNSIRRTFEKIRAAWAEKNGMWIAVDFEAWEMNHKDLTEFGWSKLEYRNGEEIVEQGHIIVSENRSCYNGKYVPNNRDYFKFGTSEVAKIAQLKMRIQELLGESQTKGPIFLVFHDYSQDIKYLQTLDAPLERATRILPDVSPDDGLFVLDTAEMFAALEGNSAERRELYRVCIRLGIRGEALQFMHNAGNDAHFTLLALKSMASGKPLDLQREERWPRPPAVEGVPQAAPGVKVEWKHEDDSDYSDTEGILGMPSNTRT